MSYLPFGYAGCVQCGSTNVFECEVIRGSDFVPGCDAGGADGAGC